MKRALSVRLWVDLIFFKCFVSVCCFNHAVVAIKSVVANFSHENVSSLVWVIYIRFLCVRSMRLIINLLKASHRQSSVPNSSIATSRKYPLSQLLVLLAAVGSIVVIPQFIILAWRSLLFSIGISCTVDCNFALF